MISIRRHPKLRSVTCRRFGTCKVLTFANFRRVSESLKFKRSCASRVERIASNWRLLLQERKIPPVSNHSGKPQWQTTVANDSDALNKLVYVLTSRRTFQNFDKFKPVSESDSLIRSLRLIIWDWSDRWIKFLRVSILPVHAHRLHWEVREFASFEIRRERVSGCPDKRFELRICWTLKTCKSHSDLWIWIVQNHQKL